MLSHVVKFDILNMNSIKSFDDLEINDTIIRNQKHLLHS